MTAEQLKMSSGEPRDINTTLMRGSRREQWVYGSGVYVYLENGEVTAIQH